MKRTTGSSVVAMTHASRTGTTTAWLTCAHHRSAMMKSPMIETWVARIQGSARACRANGFPFDSCTASVDRSRSQLSAVRCSGDGWECAIDYVEAIDVAQVPLWRTPKFRSSSRPARRGGASKKRGNSPSTVRCQQRHGSEDGAAANPGQLAAAVTPMAEHMRGADVSKASVGPASWGHRHFCSAAADKRTADATAIMIDEDKPVDRPSTQTVRVRQGTGPRAMVLVLLTSLALAAVI